METTLDDTTNVPDDLDLAAVWKKPDLAAYFQVTIRTIERWVKEGRVPRPFKIGHLIFWNFAEIKNWIERGCPRLDTWQRLRGCDDCMSQGDGSLCRGCRQFEALEAAKLEFSVSETTEDFANNEE